MPVMAATLTIPRPFTVPAPLRRLFGQAALPAERPLPADEAWMRDAWMGGASLRMLFGETVFDLQDAVGTGCANRRGDVFRLQALLHREGDLDAAITGGPTGDWSARDDDALRSFQKTNGLRVDGRAGPGGETMRRLRGFYLPEHEESGSP